MEQIEKQTKLAGRNISFDRLYTSIFLSVWLLDRKITSIGTLQHNRKGIPVELKVTKGKEELSSEIYWEKSKGKITLSSYIVNTSKGTKSVILLSTHEPILRTTKDDNKKKPALFKVYDFTKGGTDVIDQRMGISTRTKSRRWTIGLKTVKIYIYTQNIFIHTQYQNIVFQPTVFRMINAK